MKEPSKYCVAIFGLPFIFGVLLLLPPYTSLGYDIWTETAEVGFVSVQNWNLSRIFFMVMKIVPLVVLLIAWVRSKLGSRLLTLYVALAYAMIGANQGISLSEKYGLVMNLGFLLIALCLSATWVREGFSRDRSIILGCPRRPYWIIPLVFFAFWYPLDPNTLEPDFTWMDFWTNGAGLSACMMTPLFLMVLIWRYPMVHIWTLYATSSAGVALGVGNLYVNFVLDPSKLWWNGVLHLPLLIISAYGLSLSVNTLVHRSRFFEGFSVST